ncbi:XRE family transcriptional regulator (plasmid) [Mesorhizobium huakuii]|uniref:XRE family transcriptional regulator n=1 Tax=Mesorhizobium huakuii TaxID=28104 RepID=A0A7G6T672_9HYPH|nr:XRE family transcriptional regulator [Mesorhizobium huakuii]
MSAKNSDAEKIERTGVLGDNNVSIGIYAGVLQALGLLEGLSQVADIRNDSVGQALASADLPTHVHLRRPVGSSRDD